MSRKRKAPATQIVSEEEEETSNEESESESESEEEEESESESEEEEENLVSLLEPLKKEQIIDLIKESASKDPKLFSRIVEMAESDTTHRKIFVHGLSWDATSEQLLNSFRPFGEIEDAKLVTDKITGKSKGYAFVLFKTRAAAKKALKVPQKHIGNRMVSCQLAAAGKQDANLKMYVGNVGPNVNPDRLKDFFKRYGEIEEGPIGCDFVTNKFKGFAVITFKTVQGFKNAMEEPMKVFENCQLHCKKFMDKENRTNAVVNNNQVTSYGNLGGGMNPAMLGASFNMMGPNLGMGLPGNPMMAAGYNPGSMMASGLSAPFAGMGSSYGMNGISSGVMGNYGSQATMQGLGPYQNPLLGQSSVGTPETTTAVVRAPESGVLPTKSFTAYFRR